MDLVNVSKSMSEKLNKNWIKISERFVIFSFFYLQEVIPYDMKHNAETEACDLLMEIEKLDKLANFVDQNTHSRVCLYLVRLSLLYNFLFLSLLKINLV